MASNGSAKRQRTKQNGDYVTIPSGEKLPGATGIASATTHEVAAPENAQTAQPTELERAQAAVIAAQNEEIARLNKKIAELDREVKSSDREVVDMHTRYEAREEELQVEIDELVIEVDDCKGEMRAMWPEEGVARLKAQLCASERMRAEQWEQHGEDLDLLHRQIDKLQGEIGRLQGQSDKEKDRHR